MSFFERDLPADEETPAKAEAAEDRYLQSELDTAREDLRLSIEQMEATNEE